MTKVYLTSVQQRAYRGPCDMGDFLHGGVALMPLYIHTAATATPSEDICLALQIKHTLGMISLLNGGNHDTFQKKKSHHFKSYQSILKVTYTYIDLFEHGDFIYISYLYVRCN